MEYRPRNGLLVAEQGADAASLDRELRRRDPLLSLQGVLSPTWGKILWKVVREAGPGNWDTVLCWMDEQTGEPHPLSSGLLDEVDRHDRNNTRRGYRDEDAQNATLARERRRQQDRDVEALADDWNPKHGRPVLPRSQSLRMARDKRRAKGEKC